MSRILSTAKLVLFAAIFGAMIFVGCNNTSSDDEPLTGGGTESGDGTEEGGDAEEGGNTSGDIGVKFFSDLGVTVTGPIVDKNYGDSIGDEKDGIPTTIEKGCTYTESDGLVTFKADNSKDEVRAMYTFDKGVSMKDYATLKFTSKSYNGNICLYLAESTEVDWDNPEFLKGLTSVFYKIGYGEKTMNLVSDVINWGGSFDSSKYLVGAQIYNDDELIIGDLTVEKGSDDAISVTAMEIKIAESGTAGYTWTQYGESHEVTGIAYTIEMDDDCAIEDGKLKISAGKSASIDFGEDLDISKFSKISFTYACSVANSWTGSVMLFNENGDMLNALWGLGGPNESGNSNNVSLSADSKKITALKTIKFSTSDYDLTIESVKFE